MGQSYQARPLSHQRQVRPAFGTQRLLPPPEADRYRSRVVCVNIGERQLEAAVEARAIAGQDKTWAQIEARIWYTVILA
jgi:hypothetical protein